MTLSLDIICNNKWKKMLIHIYKMWNNFPRHAESMYRLDIFYLIQKKFEMKQNERGQVLINLRSSSAGWAGLGWAGWAGLGWPWRGGFSKYVLITLHFVVLTLLTWVTRGISITFMVTAPRPTVTAAGAIHCLQMFNTQIQLAGNKIWGLSGKIQEYNLC